MGTWTPFASSSPYWIIRPSVVAGPSCTPRQLNQFSCPKNLLKHPRYLIDRVFISQKNLEHVCRLMPHPLSRLHRHPQSSYSFRYARITSTCPLRSAKIEQPVTWCEEAHSTGGLPVYAHTVTFWDLKPTGFYYLHRGCQNIHQTLHALCNRQKNLQNSVLFQL